MKNYKCYFDGATLPTNPGGKMGMGIFITDGEKEFSSCNFIPAKPVNTNNIAEYLAFIMILECMKSKVGDKIEIFGDSKLVVCQMNEEWQVKRGAYREYALRAKPMVDALKLKNEVTIQWIPRELNKKADFQSMKAIGFERRSY